MGREGRSGHKATFTGREETDTVRDFQRLPHTTQCDVPDAFFGSLRPCIPLGQIA
jgi:hypothetical protein